MECGESVMWESMLPQQGGQPEDAWVTPMAVRGLCRGPVKPVRAVLSLSWEPAVGQGVGQVESPSAWLLCLGQFLLYI